MCELLDWTENGRVFRLVCRENRVGRFLVVSVRDVKGKSFRTFIPKGKGLVSGWSMLVDKLREVGVGCERKENDVFQKGKERAACSSSKVEEGNSYPSSRSSAAWEGGRDPLTPSLRWSRRRNGKCICRD